MDVDGDSDIKMEEDETIIDDVCNYLARSDLMILHVHG